jgi:hypothetical protein
MPLVLFKDAIKEKGRKRKERRKEKKKRTEEKVIGEESEGKGRERKGGKGKKWTTKTTQLALDNHIDTLTMSNEGNETDR